MEERIAFIVLASVGTGSISRLWCDPKAGRGRIRIRSSLFENIRVDSFFSPLVYAAVLF